MFGRAIITLGIGPHSSFSCVSVTFDKLLCVFCNRPIAVATGHKRNYIHAASSKGSCSHSNARIEILNNEGHSHTDVFNFHPGNSRIYIGLALDKVYAYQLPV